MQKELIHKKQIIVGGTTETLGSETITALQKVGYRVVFAFSGKEVTKLSVNNDNIVAIIIDRDQNDFSPVSQPVEKFCITRIAPLFILISEFRMSAVALALQEGYDEFLAKPVGADELLSILKNTEHHQFYFGGKFINH
ncbi:MAG: hypothetical protein PHU98_07095 [Mariniphaga sp.]|nr:hypothetical protein [Mariniphaga sp.]MDD4489719.1 hypothetical protein [Paludibacter sp.]